VPVDPATGRAIDPHDSARWLTFAEAHAGRRDVGYVLTGDDDFACIDLDHAIDPATGELTATAAALVRLTDSYVEISPSGHGLHLWLRGHLPAGHPCRGTISGQAVEVYSSKRFVTMTGHRLPASPATIETRQAELELIMSMLPPATDRLRAVPEIASTQAQPTMGLAEQTILERALRSPQFAALFRGDLSQHRNDPSAGDQSACNRLANVGASPEQVDSLIRQSGLYREKWERADYRAATITKAFDRASTAALAIAPARAAMPQKKGDCAGQLAAAEVRIHELETENGALRATVATLRERIKLADEDLGIWRNSALGAERATAAAVVQILRTKPPVSDPPPGDTPITHQVFLAEIGRVSGQSTDTVSRSLKRLTTYQASDGSRLLYKKVVTTPERIDGATGEILTELGRQLFIGTPLDIDTLGRELATLTPNRPAWGGKRTACPRCGSDRRVTACADCGLIFGDAPPNRQDAGMAAQPSPQPNGQDAVSFNVLPTRGGGGIPNRHLAVLAQRRSDTPAFQNETRSLAMTHPPMLRLHNMEQIE
jgi:hypothetical protein